MESQDRLVLVTGGARSGKSTFAERLAARLAQGDVAGHQGRDEPRSVVYLATLEANDAEMQARVVAHRAARPREWTTVECPVDVAAVLRRRSGGEAPPVYLLDCVTFWVSNLIFAGGDLGGTDPGLDFNYDKSLLTSDQEEAAAGRVRQAVDGLLEALAQANATLIAVSNEVGLGVVPEYPLARLYRDQLGWVNQRLASEADRAYLLVAGLPLDLTSLSASSTSVLPGSVAGDCGAVPYPREGRP